jgi:drug/metabolite transporter (DMT)-like permease
MNPKPAPSRVLVLAAFAVVYLVWGSTYLAIRVAIETMPPFLFAGIRFLLAGSILWGILAVRGHPRLTARQWRDSAIGGVLLMLAGNGLVVWAERLVTSSQAALFIATAPVWFTLLEWARAGGRRPPPLTWLGLALGTAGVVILTRPAQGTGVAAIPLPGLLALLAATLCWASGSVYTRHAQRPESPLMGAAAQMLCGGAALCLTGTLLGEFGQLDPARISLRSAVAFVYLVTFGSLLAYSAYVFLLRASTPARVATYAYVNPVIAVLLGHLILDEPFTRAMLTAAVLILGGVVLLTIPPSAHTRIAGACARFGRRLGLPFTSTAS